MTFTSKLEIILEKMWGKEAKDIYDSANEVFCNSPIRAFREEYKKIFGSIEIDCSDEKKAQQLLEQFAKNIDGELKAWQNIVDLFESLHLIPSNPKKK
jgi:hypothetical protein